MIAILRNLLATTGNNFIYGTIKEKSVRYLSKLLYFFNKTNKEKSGQHFFKYVNLDILSVYFIENYSIFNNKNNCFLPISGTLRTARISLC